MRRALIDPQTPARPNETLILAGEEAHHLIRVRRAAVGDAVELLDGAGRRILGRIADHARGRRGDDSLGIAVEHVDTEPPPRPWLEVWAAAPKGDRLPAMIEQLSEAGAALWTPLLTERSIVDPGLGKLDRLTRIAREAVKQCGRAYAMAIATPCDLAAAFDAPAPDEAVLLADAGGVDVPAITAPRVRVLIGPEGGWSADEVALARARGATIVRLGPHVMRIGTAAVVATAMLLGRYTPAEESP